MDDSISDNHPLLSDPEYFFHGPKSRELSGNIRFESLAGRQIANCSKTGIKTQASKLWVNGSPFLEACAERPAPSRMHPETTTGDEWHVRHTPTRELIAKANLRSAISFRDLFSVPITNGSNVRFGKLAGAFRIRRWIPLIAGRSSRRAKIQIDGQTVALVDLQPLDRKTNSIKLTKYRLRYVREISVKERLVVIGLCLVIARETLP